MEVIGYTRVSTSEQFDSGAGLEAQRAAIESECARRGWELVAIYEDTASGKSLDRPGVRDALAALEGASVRRASRASGEATAVEAGKAGSSTAERRAEGLVVAKLDRLSRSLMDFAGLMERSRKQGWSLIALDLGVDTTTPSGEMIANVLATFAQFERRLIGQRTREALAVKRSQGVQLGRPRSMPDDLRARLHDLRASGMSYNAIARLLNEEGVSTAQGGQSWHASTVTKALRPV